MLTFSFSKAIDLLIFFCYHISAVSVLEGKMKILSENHVSFKDPFLKRILNWFKKDIKDVKVFSVKAVDKPIMNDLFFYQLNIMDVAKLSYMHVCSCSQYFRSKLNDNYSIIIKTNKAKMELTYFILFDNIIIHIDSYYNELSIENIKKYIQDKEAYLIGIMSINLDDVEILTKNIGIILSSIRSCPNYNDSLVIKMMDMKYLFKGEFFTKFKLSYDTKEKPVIEDILFRYSITKENITGGNYPNIFYKYLNSYFIINRLDELSWGEISKNIKVESQHNNGETNEIEIYFFRRISKKEVFTIRIQELSNGDITLCFYRDDINCSRKLLKTKKGGLNDYHDFCKIIDDFIFEKSVKFFLSDQDRETFNIYHDDELSEIEFENVKEYIKLIHY